MRLKYVFLSILSMFLVCLGATVGCALQPSECIDARGLTISWIHGINNNIRILYINDEVKYFRECKKR